MIELINKEFVSVEINVTETGFPEDIPALKPWKNAFEKDPSYKVGFATSVVIGPGGAGAFGTSGCGHMDEWKESINYHADKFKGDLESSLARYKKAKETAEDKTLEGDAKAAKLKEIGDECVKAIAEAAKCRKKAEK